MVEEASAALGPIDILINSAGVARRYDPDSLDAAAYKAAMDAKYFSYVYPQQVVLIPGATLTERVEEALALEAQRLGVTRDQALADSQAKVPMMGPLRKTRGNRRCRALSGEPSRKLRVGRDHPDGRSIVADHLMVAGSLNEREPAEWPRGTGGRPTSPPPRAKPTRESSKSTPTRYCPPRPSAPR